MHIKFSDSDFVTEIKSIPVQLSLFETLLDNDPTCEVIVLTNHHEVLKAIIQGNLHEFTIKNDVAKIHDSLMYFGYPPELMRDWYLECVLKPAIELVQNKKVIDQYLRQIIFWDIDRVRFEYLNNRNLSEDTYIEVLNFIKKTPIPLHHFLDSLHRLILYMQDINVSMRIIQMILDTFDQIDEFVKTPKSRQYMDDSTTALFGYPCISEEYVINHKYPWRLKATNPNLTEKTFNKFVDVDTLTEHTWKRIINNNNALSGDFFAKHLNHIKPLFKYGYIGNSNENYIRFKLLFRRGMTSGLDTGIEVSESFTKELIGAYPQLHELYLNPNLSDEFLIQAFNNNLTNPILLRTIVQNPRVPDYCIIEYSKMPDVISIPTRCGYHLPAEARKHLSEKQAKNNLDVFDAPMTISDPNIPFDSIKPDRFSEVDYRYGFALNPFRCEYHALKNALLNIKIYPFDVAWKKLIPAYLRTLDLA